MEPAPTILIVGLGGAAGYAAGALRAGGFAERVILIGVEPDRPYERPPISNLSELAAGHGRHLAGAGPVVAAEQALAQTERFRRDLDQFIVADEI